MVPSRTLRPTLLPPFVLAALPPFVLAARWLVDDEGMQPVAVSAAMPMPGGISGVGLAAVSGGEQPDPAASSAGTFTTVIPSSGNRAVSRAPGSPAFSIAQLACGRRSAKRRSSTGSGGRDAGRRTVSPTQGDMCEPSNPDHCLEDQDCGTRSPTGHPTSWCERGSAVFACPGASLCTADPRLHVGPNQAVCK